MIGYVRYLVPGTGTWYLVRGTFFLCFLRNSARDRQTGAVTVGNPYESAAKQTSPLPAQAGRTKGDGVVPNLVLLTYKGGQKAGFQQEEKTSVHQSPQPVGDPKDSSGLLLWEAREPPGANPELRGHMVPARPGAPGSLGGQGP